MNGKLTAAIVVCVRDPDESNTFSTFGAMADLVEIVDIDLGRADLKNREEFEEWKSSHLETAADLRRRGFAAAAHEVEEVVATQGERHS